MCIAPNTYRLLYNLYLKICDQQQHYQINEHTVAYIQISFTGSHLTYNAIPQIRSHLSEPYCRDIFIALWNFWQIWNHSFVCGNKSHRSVLLFKNFQIGCSVIEMRKTQVQVTLNVVLQSSSGIVKHGTHSWKSAIDRWKLFENIKLYLSEIQAIVVKTLLAFASNPPPPLTLSVSSHVVVVIFIYMNWDRTIRFASNST